MYNASDASLDAHHTQCIDGIEKEKIEIII